MFKKKILINLNCLRVVEIQNTFEYEGNYYTCLLLKTFSSNIYIILLNIKTYLHRYLYLASNIIGNKILSNIILYYNVLHHMIIIYIKNVNRSYLNIVIKEGR